MAKDSPDADPPDPPMPDHAPVKGKEEARQGQNIFGMPTVLVVSTAAAFFLMVVVLIAWAV